MAKFRLLIRTVDGNRVSSQVSLVDAAAAVAIYKHLHGMCPEVVPDTGPLRQAHAAMDEAAMKAANDLAHTSLVLWDRRFCLKTAAEPAGRIEPAEKKPPRAAPVSPERPPPWWAYAIGWVIVTAQHPLRTARYLARRCWRWLVGEVEPSPAARREGFLAAPPQEVGPC